MPSPPSWVFRKGKDLKELRDEDKKDKKKSKKSKATPYLNPKNKIMLETKNRLGEKIRESNRTKILLDLEYMP
jgi:hypothetical protein